MSASRSSEGRRKLLIAASAAIGGVGIAGAAVPFVRSWNPSAKAKAAGAAVEANVSKLEVGQKLVVEWRGRPVWIVRRSEKNLQDLQRSVDYLRDPESQESNQPDFAKNSHRSINPEFLILTGLCTHLGCSPTYRPEVGAADLGGGEWLGGFFCPCHGSKFDLAGRVYKSVPAPTNLDVPPYYFVNDDVVVIGEIAASVGAV